MLSDNLFTLRKMRGMSQEEAAEKIGVSRQALSKWESGETVPDMQRCMDLASLYEVSLDDLANYSAKEQGLPIPPKGKHLFGAVTVGEKGQIVIPKEARKIFRIEAGDKLFILGDEAQGLAMIRADDMLAMMHDIKKMME